MWCKIDLFISISYIFMDMCLFLYLHYCMHLKTLIFLEVVHIAEAWISHFVFLKIVALIYLFDNFTVFIKMTGGQQKKEMTRINKIQIVYFHWCLIRLWYSYLHLRTDTKSMQLARCSVTHWMPVFWGLFFVLLKNLASIWEMYFAPFLQPKTVNELTLPSDQIALENDSITVI